MRTCIWQTHRALQTEFFCSSRAQADATLLLRDLSFIAIANHPTLRFARSLDLPLAERFSQHCARTDLPYYSTLVTDHTFFELCYYEAPIAEQKAEQTDDTPAEADDGVAHDPETANRLSLVEDKKERTELRLCAIVYQLQGTYDPPGSFRCSTQPKCACTRLRVSTGGRSATAALPSVPITSLLQTRSTQTVCVALVIV